MLSKEEWAQARYAVKINNTATLAIHAANAAPVNTKVGAGVAPTPAVTPSVKHPRLEELKKNVGL